MTYYNYSALEQPAVNGATHRLTIKYTDLTDTAATSLTTAIFPETDSTTFPIGCQVQVLGCKVSTAFAGGAVSALTLKIGDGGDDDRYMTTTYGDLFTATHRAIPAGVTTQPYVYAAADTVDAIFTATGANLTALTAGQVDIYLKFLPVANWEVGV